MVATLGKLIKTIREQARLTSQELAELANVSQPYISQIENDRRQPSYNTLLAIAQALNTPIDTFLHADTSAPYRPSAPTAGFIASEGSTPGYGSAPSHVSLTSKSGFSLHTLVDYAVAIENARQAHITPEELYEAVEALKKLKKLREKT